MCARIRRTTLGRQITVLLRRRTDRDLTTLRCTIQRSPRPRASPPRGPRSARNDLFLFLRRRRRLLGAPGRARAGIPLHFVRNRRYQVPPRGLRRALRLLRRPSPPCAARSTRANMLRLPEPLRRRRLSTARRHPCMIDAAPPPRRLLLEHTLPRRRRLQCHVPQPSLFLLLGSPMQVPSKGEGEGEVQPTRTLMPNIRVDFTFTLKSNSFPVCIVAFCIQRNILTHSQCFSCAINSEATACHNHKGPIITRKETGSSELRIVQAHLEEYDTELAHAVFKSQDRSAFCLSFAFCCLMFLSISRVSICPVHLFSKVPC